MLTHTKYDASISNKFNIFRGLTDRDPGSFHDSTVYRLSEFKPYLESRWPRETCIGDSAFAISDVMMVPYPKPRGRDRQNKGTL